MRTLLHTRLRPMAPEDIAQVAEIERESFPAMWPQTAYRRELTNKIARYAVITEVRGDAAADDADESSVGESSAGASRETARGPGFWGAIRKIVGPAPETEPAERLLGFIGLWLMVGDAHIVTVAVREQYRRMGIGERLVIRALEIAMESHQETVTLEVRSSNEGAMRLYEKYGFVRAGLRKRYYTDNNEDAVIMTTPDLLAPSFRALFQRRREGHRALYPDLWA